MGSPYPQPTRDHVRIPVDLPVESLLRADVYNLLGRRVCTLFDGTLPAGRHLLPWDGLTESGLPAPTGNYLLRVAASGQQTTLPLLLLR